MQIIIGRDAKTSQLNVIIGQQTLRLSTRNLDAWLTEVMELLNAAAPSGTSSEAAG